MVITMRGWARLGVLALAVLFVVGCMEAMDPSPPKDDPKPDETYQPTAVPDDIDDLFELYGNENSDTVWIYAQGGPAHKLGSGVHEVGDGQLIYLGYEAFRHYPEHREIRFVQVHQTLTLNHELAEWDAADWDLEKLQAEVDVSVAILHRTIGHFKAQGKHVVVIGHSYGAFLVTRYLAIEGPDAADQYLVMAGRLDMPEEVVEGYLSGIPYLFPDAVNPVAAVRGFSRREVMEFRIAGATGHDRYTEKLAGVDLGKVIYVYGYNDKTVGRLADEEIRFLTDRNSTVIEVRSVIPGTGGDHATMFEPAAALLISEALNR